MIPLLIVASIWYLAMTSVLYVGQYYLERHFARGVLARAAADATAAIAAELARLDRALGGSASRTTA